MSKKLLGPEIGAEAGLGHDIVGELQRGARGDHRIAAMGDIGERPAMDEGGRALQRLHQVRHQRIAQQHRHRALGVELGRRDRALAAGAADDDAPQPFLQIGEIIGEAEDRHHLGGDGDVEAVLAREAVRRAAERGHDRTQRPVVHVDDATPGDMAFVEIEPVAPIDMVVEHRRQQVMGAGDRVEIAGEVQVDLLHRHDLRIAAAGRPALLAEAGAERGLAQRDHGALAQALQPVAEADRRRGLALAGGRRADRGHEDELAVRLLGEIGDSAGIDLGDVLAIGVQRRIGDAGRLGDRADRLKRRRAGDLDIGRHAVPQR